MFSTTFRTFPWPIAVVALGLMAFGMLAIAMAERGGGLLWRQQAIWMLLALGAALVATLPHYNWLQRYAYVGLAICIGFCLAVYLFPAVNGSHRWIRLGPVGFQPSELTKLFYVAAVSRWLMHRETQRHLSGLVVPLSLAAVPAFIILREPDLGTAIVFLPVLFCLLLAAGSRLSHIGLIALAGVMLLPVFWSAMSREQISRVTAVVNQTGAGERPDDDGFHLHQAKQLVALGGLTGMEQERIEHDPLRSYVPAAATDSVFVVLCHHYGLVAGTVVLLLYFVLVWQMVRVALATEDPFAQLFVAGVAALFAVQVKINTAMMLGLLPITGLSLPLISYGGTGLLVHAFAIGIVLNIGTRRSFAVAGAPFRFARAA